MKNYHTKSLIVFIACVLFSLCGTQVQAQTLLNYPLDTVNGVEVYRYHIERGVGIYRIGVNFNVSKEVLYRYNPQLRNGVKYNQLLFIPTGRPINGNKSQNVAAKAQQPAPAPQKAESKPVVTETPVVAAPQPVPVVVPAAPQPAPVVVPVAPQPAPVVVPAAPQPAPVVVVPQPAPAVKEPNIAACRTIVIGPNKKDGNSNQAVSTLCLGPNKMDCDRPAEIDVIRIAPKK